MSSREPIRSILFDLDGTLTDSAPGIMASVQYALEKLSIREQDPAVLRRFIGPPLTSQFILEYGVSQAQAEQLLLWYRERYNPIGIYENSLFPGIEPMLARLQAKGYRLFVATGKPEVMALRVTDYFAITGYFVGVGGASLDHSRETKAQVVRYIMDRWLDGSADRTIMVGDRDNDIEGARVWGIPTVGVTWGYGAPGELAGNGAAALADTPEALYTLINRWGREDGQ